MEPCVTIRRIAIHCDSPLLRCSLHDHLIYGTDQPDTCEAKIPRAHQLKKQSNSNKARNITAQTKKTIGILISISFMALGKIRSPMARASEFSVMTHLSYSPVFKALFWDASNVPLQTYGKLHGCKGDTSKHIMGLWVWQSVFQVELPEGNSRHCTRFPLHFCTLWFPNENMAGRGVKSIGDVEMRPTK